MIEKIEFYNTPDGSVCCKPEGKPMFILDESCRPLIEEMIVTIKELYPDAFKALSELYSTSERNRSFYEYRIVHRCFNGRKVIIFDDVITKGKSFSTMVEYLEEMGAKVVGGIFLAATAFQHNNA